jgi:hypothetical protein
LQTTSPKLPLTIEEKQSLKACKVKLNEIALLDVPQLSEYLNSSKERARYIRGLAQFQAVPSIGPRVAQRVVELGYFSLEEVRNKQGCDLINSWEAHCGYWEDPCLEDAFWCIVHHANNPESDRSWFDFTVERKKYREQYGYPATRPTLSWQEKRK